MKQIGIIGLTVLALLACNKNSSPTGPSSQESEVTGTWISNMAITIDTVQALHAIKIEIQGTHSFVITTKVDGILVVQENGSWKVSGNQFISTPSQCQEADSTDVLKLVACPTTADSTLINIVGGNWAIKYLDPVINKLTSFTFTKV